MGYTQWWYIYLGAAGIFVTNSMSDGLLAKAIGNRFEDRDEAIKIKEQIELILLQNKKH